MLMTAFVADCQDCPLFFLNSSDSTNKNQIRFSISDCSFDSLVWEFDDLGNVVNVKNPTFLFPGGGLYRVCVSAYLNDTINSRYCEQINIPFLEDDSSQIYGLIKDNDVLIKDEMNVVLFRIINQKREFYQYTTSRLGTFRFNEVGEGNYLAVVYPSDNSGYVPTFFGQTLKWQKSPSIEFLVNVHDLTFRMLSKRDLNDSGEGSIQLKIPERVVDSIIHFFGSDWSKFMPVVLSTLKSTPIYHQTFENVDTLNFVNLPFGQYHVTLANPLFTTSQSNIELSPESNTSEVNIQLSNKVVLASSISGSDVLFWPNPSELLHFNSKQIDQISIFNEQATEVLHCAKIDHFCNTSILPSGCYFLIMTLKNGKVLTRKFIKRTQ